MGKLQCECCGSFQVSVSNMIEQVYHVEGTRKQIIDKHLEFNWNSRSTVRRQKDTNPSTEQAQKPCLGHSRNGYIVRRHRRKACPQIPQQLDSLRSVLIISYGGGLDRHRILHFPAVSPKFSHFHAGLSDTSARFFNGVRPDPGGGPWSRCERRMKRQ